MHTTRQLRSTLCRVSLLVALAAAPAIVLAQATPAGATPAIRPTTATPAAPASPAPTQNAVPNVGGDANGNVNIRGTIHNDFDSTAPKTIDSGAARIADPSRNNDRVTDPSRDNPGTSANSSNSSAGRVGAATPKRPVNTRDRAQPRRTTTKKPRPTVDESNVAGVTSPQPRNQSPAAPSSL